MEIMDDIELNNYDFYWLISQFINMEILIDEVTFNAFKLKTI